MDLLAHAAMEVAFHSITELLGMVRDAFHGLSGSLCPFRSSHGAISSEFGSPCRVDR